MSKPPPVDDIETGTGQTAEAFFASMCEDRITQDDINYTPTDEEMFFSSMCGREEYPNNKWVNGTDSSIIKRRKISDDIIGIFDIPDGALVHVTTYLSKPSVALLALSLTCESASWKKIKWNEWNKKVSPILAWAKVTKREPSSASKLIISSYTWESIDFSEFGGANYKWLGRNLTDDAVAGVLACINARKNLKTLKITSCVNISGRGLQFLSGSLVLQNIDLRHQLLRPDIETNSSLSESSVLPILESIINTPGNMLTLVHFPEKWRKARSPELKTLLVDYSRLLGSRRNPCSKCRSLRNYGGWVNYEDEESDSYFGMQNYTCHKCVKFFCYDCNNGGNDPTYSFYVVHVHTMPWRIL